MNSSELSSETSDALVIVGDGMVGKTALLFSYTCSTFEEDYTPTVFDSTCKDVYVPSKNRTICLSLWDTGGQEEFDQIRVMMYPGAKVVLLCYSIDNKISLENVVQTWIPELRQYCPNVPFILVGCKADMRCPHTDKTKLVTPSEAQEVAHKIGAAMHIECSSKTRANVDLVFEQAADLVYRRQLASLSNSTRTRRPFLFGKRVPSQRLEGETSPKIPTRASSTNSRNRPGFQRYSLWCVPIKNKEQT